MEVINSEYKFFLLILLAIFSLVSTMIGGVTVFNAFRLRNVRMSWRAGNLKGYPLFSTVFLVISICLLGYAFFRGTIFDLVAFLLYFWMSGGWFITSYLASKRYITDNGIVKNINDPSQTIPWYQIRDFVEKEIKSGKHYIFLYREDPKLDRERFIRLDLQVPAEKDPDFKKLISHKLGRQINCLDTGTLDVRQFDTG